jgi:hypothetical protein
MSMNRMILTEQLAIVEGLDKLLKLKLAGVNLHFLFYQNNPFSGTHS